MAFSCCVASAAAWRATVLPPGAATLDLGVLEDAPAVFATFPDGSGAVTLTATNPAQGTTRIRLFAPDRLPERRMSGDELPSIAVDGAAAVTFGRDDEPQLLRDPATGIRFRTIGTLDLPSSSGSQAVTLRIEPGSLPARALLVAGAAGETANFELDSPASVPGTVSRMRLWSDVPPTGTPGRLLREAKADQRSATPAVVLAAVVSLAMVLLAVWWVLRGRAESRRRGVERSGPD